MDRNDANIKGLAILNVLEALKAAGPEARRRLGPHLQHYFDELILASSWYPEADHWELSHVLADLTAVPGRDIWEYFGRKSAEAELGTTYSALVKGGPSSRHPGALSAPMGPLPQGRPLGDRLVERQPLHPRTRGLSLHER